MTHNHDTEPWSASPDELAWMDAELQQEHARATAQAAYDDWLEAQGYDGDDMDYDGHYWQEGE